MRVLHVLNSVEHSGAESCLRDALSCFEAAGFEFSILATGEEVGSMADEFERLGVPVKHIRRSRSAAFPVRVAALIRAGGYDVVHVHTERAAFWLELAALAVGTRRVVRSVHSVFSFSGTLRVRRSIGRVLASRVLGVRHVFVGPSVAANERRMFWTRGQVVPNGLDVGRFHPLDDDVSQAHIRATLGLPGETVAVIASIGSCITMKQHAHVIQAVQRLNSEGLAVHYLHVGSGPIEDDERRLVGALDVSDYVHFLGTLDDVVPVLQGSDVFVMPSQYEGLGVAALEAASCGLPVIGYDVPGLRDVVSDGETGLLLEDQNAAALADALRVVLEDRSLRAEFGRQGRAHVVQQHDVEDWARSVMGVYAR